MQKTDTKRAWTNKNTKPRKPRSAQLFHSLETRPVVKLLYPNFTPRQLARDVQCRWKSLSEQQKKVYERESTWSIPHTINNKTVYKPTSVLYVKGESYEQSSAREKALLSWRVKVADREALANSSSDDEWVETKTPVRGFMLDAYSDDSDDDTMDNLFNTTPLDKAPERTHCPPRKKVTAFTLFSSKYRPSLEFESTVCDRGIMMMLISAWEALSDRERMEYEASVLTL